MPQFIPMNIGEEIQTNLDGVFRVQKTFQDKRSSSNILLIKKAAFC